jgi:hypothetical protein
MNRQQILPGMIIPTFIVSRQSALSGGGFAGCTSFIPSFIPKGVEHVSKQTNNNIRRIPARVNDPTEGGPVLRHWSPLLVKCARSLGYHATQDTVHSTLIAICEAKLLICDGFVTL